MKRFTPEEDQFLRDNYLTMPASAMSRALGRSNVAARQRMVILGLVVPPDIVQQFIAASRIKTGNTPFNKGKRLAETVAPEAIERMKRGWFKKGNLPHNTKTDMEISIRPDKRGVKYKFIRTSLAVWTPLQRYVWEQANGPIPKGGKIIFKDSDPMNCDLHNLELLTSGQLMRRNTIHNYPDDIKQVIRLQGKLNRTITKHIKNLNNEKQD